ncbi:hypothetical protein [Nocardia asiatica]|uniref:hypothetical protein n=1 Tax=Nocardia asiatica TaxID=209252 RepID=UPI002455FE73|nr:hypothetical protein [Nocardia asiatica]
MFARNRNVRPETMIKAIEAAKPIATGAVVGPDGIRRLPRVHTEHDHRADSIETQRQRRRTHLSVVYDERLRLSAEVVEAVSGAASSIASDRRPARWTIDTGDAFGTIAKAITEIAGKVRAPAPRWPATLSAGAVVDQGWARMLTEAARDLDDRVSAALAPSAPGAANTSEFIVERLRTIDNAGRSLGAYVGQIQAAEAPMPPAPTQAAVAAADPMEALRRRHSREREELRERQSAEWATASADVKAARIAAQAARS